MGRFKLWGAMGILILGLGLGCRAFGGKSGDAPAPTASPTPQPTPIPSASPQVSPPPNETTKSELYDFNDNFRIDLLREALGRTSLGLLQDLPVYYKKAQGKGDMSPNFQIELGDLHLSQDLGSQGQLHLAISGPYQRLLTVSGVNFLQFGPITVELATQGFPVTSGCGREFQLTGNIQCTVSGVYEPGSQKMTASGQCMTHSHGILDTLRMKLGSGSLHSVRYVLGVKIQGNPLDWSAYSWTGTPLVNGLKSLVPDTSKIKYKCD